MRLSEGLFIDEIATFGELKFSALRRENFVNDEAGNPTSEIKSRTYDLKSKGQGMMIQVQVPAEVPLKEFEYNALVELVNPTIMTTANANYRGAEVDWHLTAEDLVLKGETKAENKNNTPGGAAGNPTGNTSGTVGTTGNAGSHENGDKGKDGNPGVKK